MFDVWLCLALFDAWCLVMMLVNSCQQLQTTLANNCQLLPKMLAENALLLIEWLQPL